MNKNILIGLGVIIVIGGIGLFVMTGAKSSEINTNGPEVPAAVGDTTTSTRPDQPGVTDTPSAPAGQSTSALTLSSIASHNSRTSCYTAINGGVYDVTTYIDKHPGGPEQVLAVCGKDGSPLFGGQHSGNQKIANMLKDFKIGDLSN
jgi:hypothetical protein